MALRERTEGALRGDAEAELIERERRDRTDRDPAEDGGWVVEGVRRQNQLIAEWRRTPADVRLAVASGGEQ